MATRMTDPLLPAPSSLNQSATAGSGDTILRNRQSLECAAPDVDQVLDIDDEKDFVLDSDTLLKYSNWSRNHFQSAFRMCLFYDFLGFIWMVILSLSDPPADDGAMIVGMFIFFAAVTGCRHHAKGRTRFEWVMNWIVMTSFFSATFFLFLFTLYPLFLGLMIVVFVAPVWFFTEFSAWTLLLFCAFFSMPVYLAIMHYQSRRRSLLPCMVLTRMEEDYFEYLQETQHERDAKLDRQLEALAYLEDEALQRKSNKSNKKTLPHSWNLGALFLLALWTCWTVSNSGFALVGSAKTIHS